MTEGPGKKLVCQECGTKFFDLNRPNPTCPKCSSKKVTALELVIAKLKLKEPVLPVIEPEDEEVAADIDDDEVEELETEEVETEEEDAIEDRDTERDFDDLDTEPQETFEDDEL